MIILGIDPGTGRMGYGIIKKEAGRISHIAHGCLETKAHTPHPDRLHGIHLKMMELIETHRPDIVGVEKLFFAKNVTTAMSVSEARGVIILAARHHNLRIIEHTPMQIKQAVTGHGGADKRQVQEMVKMLMKLKVIPKPDDAADAIAVAYCAAVTESLERTLKKTA